jgi:hypothetical protein
MIDPCKDLQDKVDRLGVQIDSPSRLLEVLDDNPRISRDDVHQLLQEIEDKKDLEIDFIMAVFDLNDCRQKNRID